MLLKKSLICLFVLLLFSCSEKNLNKKNTKETNRDPQILYELALKDLKNDNLEKSKAQFEEIEKKYPLSSRAIQSKIMLAFIEYLSLNYNEANFKLNSIIKMYPSYKDIDYAYYMRALCYYEQINHQELEGENTILAIENFNQVINRFPNSKYAKDSNQKIILLKENLAAKNMEIALFYLNQKKYLAAINRYNVIIKDFNKTKFTPEALYRITEIYITLGMIADAKKINLVLKYNYPKSKWYNYSEKLLSKNLNIKTKNSFFKTISNLIKTNNEDK